MFPLLKLTVLRIGMRIGGTINPMKDCWYKGIRGNAPNYRV